MYIQIYTYYYTSTCSLFYYSSQQIIWFEKNYCYISVITYITVDLLFVCNKGIGKQAMLMWPLSQQMSADDAIGVDQWLLVVTIIKVS